MPNEDIQLAIDTIKRNLPARQRYVNYYDGNHELAFATEKFKSAFGHTLQNMRDNLCPIVVDAPADRMEIINFSGDEEEKESAIAAEAWELWQRELMELVSNETHVEAIKTGCAYLIVWADPASESERKAKFYLQDSRNVCIIEDEETDIPKYAAKMWDVGMEKQVFVRITLYYPDRTEKYITAKKRAPGQQLKAEHFIPYDENPVEENPWGILPVFKFETQPILDNAIPMQDVLNKTLADRMVSQEFAAFRQRWATGLEPPTDELTGMQKKIFDGGADRLWFTNEKEVKFGEFEATALDPFLKASDADRVEMARVTGTPLHFFSINTSDAISGEALKTLESRFTKKVKRLCLNFGAVWSRAMKLALQIEGGSVSEQNLTAQWESPEYRSDKEFLETLLLKQDLGVPAEVLMEEYGYTKEDIAKFDIEPEQDAAVAAARQMPNETQNQRVAQTTANGTRG